MWEIVGVSLFGVAVVLVGVFVSQLLLAMSMVQGRHVAKVNVPLWPLYGALAAFVLGFILFF